MDFVAFYWVRLAVSKCDQVSTIYLVSSVLHKNIVTFSLAGNKIVCLFIYKSLILNTLSHIRTMSSSYSIRRIWRWKETTELKRSTQRHMHLFVCLTLKQRASSHASMNNLYSWGRSSRARWQEAACLTLLLYWYWQPISEKQAL